jgi:hypothetical protein
MVAEKDPSLKGIGFSLCFRLFVPAFRLLLVSMVASVGNLWEESIG